MGKNILLITQEYPADDLEKEFTPVVHFFAKEWVLQGHNVVTINLPTNFPHLYYWGAKVMRRRLESRLGINIRTYKLSKREYELDGVNVLRFPLKKIKPHGRFPKCQIAKGINKLVEYCKNKNFKPDVIIGHWTNPTVDMMMGLKKIYKVPCALVMHDRGLDFDNIYRNNLKDVFSTIDCWGFRSFPIKQSFEKSFGVQQKTFMCFSGVPDNYISIKGAREFYHIKRFLYVGLLLKRKHPFELVMALYKSELQDYSLDIVGQGDEYVPINQFIRKHPDISSKVKLCGRISRDEVSEKMQKADVFCMISNSETYGLVYIEAMSAGCITIASRNEGFDGIIVDGENGFLCEAGNIDELTSIINKINKMDKAELNRISENAIKTAKQMTDSNVAASYIHDVERLLNL